MPVLLTTALLLAVVLCIGLLVRRGFRDGDLPGDAIVRVRLVPIPGQEGSAAGAEVVVDNPNDSAATVSVRIRRSSTAGRLVTGELARRTATTRRRSGVLVLGRVEGRAERRWVAPAAPSAARVVRVTVRVDQVERRTRVVSVVLPVPAAWRPQARPSVADPHPAT